MVEVKRREHETVASMLRRFTRRVQQSGVLVRSRRTRFYVPAPNKRARHAKALRRIKVVKEKERLAKLGKLEETKRRF